MANARTVGVSIILILAALGAIGAGGWYFYEQQNYVITDNAAIQGTITPITATGDGTLTNWKAAVGSTVGKGAVLGRINGLASNVELTAPISGTIVQNDAVNDEVVVPGEQIGYMVNLNDLQIVANIDETSINNVTVGKTVDVTIDAYPDTQFTGTVTQIGSASTVLTQGVANTSLSSNFQKTVQRIPVYISIQGTEGKNLMPGMSVEVSIHRN